MSARTKATPTAIRVAGPNSWDLLKDPAGAGVLDTISVGLADAVGALVSEGLAEGVLDDGDSASTLFPDP